MNDIFNQSILLEQRPWHNETRCSCYKDLCEWTEKTHIYASLSMSSAQKSQVSCITAYIIPLVTFRLTKMDSLCRGHLSSIFIIHAWNKANPINLEPEFPFSIIYLNIFMCVFKSCNFSLIKSTMSWHWFSCHT